MRVDTKPLPFLDPALSLEKRIADLLGRLALQEKIALLSHRSPAVERLGIPEYNWWNEGMHGVSRAGIATVFPQSIAMAASWNTDLMLSVADAISTEARAKHHAVASLGDRGIYKGLSLWSPNINIYRDPRWGRGHETYGEDPFLTGSIAQSFVRGIQGDHPVYYKAIATPKHFAAHSGPEKDRHGFNACVDPKDLAETYLPAFKKCIDAKAASVMGAYNRLNDHACCASRPLLNDLLRSEWGFDGYVVSDCGAITDIAVHHALAPGVGSAAALAVANGCDLFCGLETSGLPKEIEAGTITEDTIDIALRRVLAARFKLGMFDEPQLVPWAATAYEALDCPEHRELARTMAAQSIVLLKNNGILPLSPDIGSVAVIGPNARSLEALVANYHGTPSQYSTIVDGVRTHLATGSAVFFSEGCPLSKVGNSSWGERADMLFTEALLAAQRSRVIILALGLTSQLEGEQGDAANSDASGDRLSLRLPGLQEQLLAAMVATGKPVILVLLNGGALELPPQADGASAILEAWYPGEEGGNAVADILFGLTAPSGRLPVTWYRSIDDLPPFASYSMQGRTYRYCTKPVAYPFGFGLSYTTFSYANLRIPASIPCGEPLVLRIDITNEGAVDAWEVVQVYLEHMDAPMSDSPIRTLVAFQKLMVRASTSVTVELVVQPSELVSVNAEGSCDVLPGAIKVSVGGSQPDAQSCLLGAPEAAEAVVGLTGKAVHLWKVPSSLHPRCSSDTP